MTYLYIYCGIGCLCSLYTGWLMHKDNTPFHKCNYKSRKERLFYRVIALAAIVPLWPLLALAAIY